MTDSKTPILVTGMPRSGTTWLASMLDHSGRTVYVNEPLNPDRPPGRSPGVLDATAQHRFQYICRDNEGEYLEALENIRRLRYGLGRELRANRKPADRSRFDI